MAISNAVVAGAGLALDYAVPGLGTTLVAVKGLLGHKPKPICGNCPADAKLLVSMLQTDRPRGMEKLFGYLRKVGNCSGWGSGCAPMRRGYLEVAQRFGIAVPAACSVGGKGGDASRRAAGCVAPMVGYMPSPDPNAQSLNPLDLLATIGTPQGAPVASGPAPSYGYPVNYAVLYRGLFR